MKKSKLWGMCALLLTVGVTEGRDKCTRIVDTITYKIIKTSSDEIDVEKTFQLKCRKGFRVTGQTNNNVRQATVKCVGANEFDPPPPFCERERCPPVQAGKDANLVPIPSGTELEPGKSYTFECREGYTTSSPLTTICLGNLTYSTLPPVCTKVKCSKPGEGKNTVKVEKGTSLEFLEAYTYECETGFIPDGGIQEMTIVCQADGKYKPSTQRKCNKDKTDYCKNSPCKAKGECLNGVGGFYCKCRVGRTGPTCEKKENQCVSNPCANGGKCKGDTKKFTCKCTDTWTGKTCKKRKCPIGWIRSDMQVCYLLVDGPQRSWFSAATDCRDQNSNLVFLKTLAKVQDLAKINSGVKNVNYWVGGGQVFDPFGAYVWIDETAVDASIISAGTNELQSEDNDMITFQFQNGSPVIGSATSNQNFRYICEQ